MTWETFWSWLSSWQTLVGALLGGVFGLTIALVVAHDARWREYRSSAYFLITQLKSLAVWKKYIWTLEETINKHFANLDELRRKHTQTSDSAFSISATLRVLRTRPRLSQLFEQSMTRVMGVDQILAAHLGIFWEAALAAERILENEQEKLVKDAERFDREIQAGRNPVLMQDFKRYQVSQLETAVMYGSKAMELLQKLVLDRGASWKRLARRCRSLKKEEDYLKGVQREQQAKGGI